MLVLFLHERRMWQWKWVLILSKFVFRNNLKCSNLRFKVTQVVGPLLRTSDWMLMILWKESLLCNLHQRNIVKQIDIAFATHCNNQRSKRNIHICMQGYEWTTYLNSKSSTTFIHEASPPKCECGFSMSTQFHQVTSNSVKWPNSNTYFLAPKWVDTYSKLNTYDNLIRNHWLCIVVYA